MFAILLLFIGKVNAVYVIPLSNYGEMTTPMAIPAIVSSGSEI